MPKHGITALVDFIEPFEAKKAFSKLAYSQFKTAPLYLEWAPENVFIKSKEKVMDTKESEEIETKTSEQTEMKSETNIKEDKETNINKSVSELVEEEETPENDTTLFVKNLNFITTDDSLRVVSIHSTCIDNKITDMEELAQIFTNM